MYYYMKLADAFGRRYQVMQLRRGGKYDLRIIDSEGESFAVDKFDSMQAVSDYIRAKEVGVSNEEEK